MTDAGFIQIVKRLLAVKSRKEALEVCDNSGADYRDLSQQLAHRIEYKRTDDQNSLYWKWAGEVAKNQGETKEDTHREAKLSIGCPILCRDSEDFLTMYRQIIAPLPRGPSDDEKEMTRLKMMDWVDVSSVMTTRQMVEFMDEFEKKWRMRGVRLTMPEMAE